MDLNSKNVMVVELPGPLDVIRGYSKKEIRAMKESARQGDPVSMMVLAGGYYMGDGVPADKRECVKWCRKAAQQGVADAQYNLGSCCYNGDGVSQDDWKAVKWWRRASMQGHAKAQESLVA